MRHGEQGEAKVQWTLARSARQRATLEVNTAKVIYSEVKINQMQVSQNELQPIRFQGQYIDEETGLHYNRFRYDVRSVSKRSRRPF